MMINLEKIKELYGDNIVREMKNNLEEITENLKYLMTYNIENFYEILECYPYLFMKEPKSFQKKLDEFIMKIGDNYIEKLEKNMSMWSELI